MFSCYFHKIYHIFGPYFLISRHIPKWGRESVSTQVVRTLHLHCAENVSLRIIPLHNWIAEYFHWLSHLILKWTQYFWYFWKVHPPNGQSNMLMFVCIQLQHKQCKIWNLKTHHGHRNAIIFSSFVMHACALPKPKLVPMVIWYSAHGPRIPVGANISTRSTRARNRSKSTIQLFSNQPTKRSRCFFALYKMWGLSLLFVFVICDVFMQRSISDAKMDDEDYYRFFQWIFCCCISRFRLVQ